VTQSLEDVP
jgi:hypothetical protein